MPVGIYVQKESKKRKKIRPRDAPSENDRVPQSLGPPRAAKISDYGNSPPAISAKLLFHAPFWKFKSRGEIFITRFVEKI